MHKSLFIIMPMILMTITPALARVDTLKNSGKGPYSGSNNSCYYIKNYGSKKGGDNFAYMFCGQMYSKCDGHKNKGHDLGKLHFQGDGFTWNGRTFWCCTNNGTYRYIEAQNWIATTKDGEVKSIGNGTCTTKIETDVCGEEHFVDCGKPETCDSLNDFAFASEEANECVKCTPTNYQGVKVIDGYGVCIKCDSTTEFFDRIKGDCVKKSASAMYSKITMKTCFMCPDLDEYKKCIEAVQKNTTSGIDKKCHVTNNNVAP